jgi:hypothetical protein
MGNFFVCIFTFLASLNDPDPLEPDIHEFAIAPHYQSRGLGKQLARHLIALAKEQGLNIALTATSGKLHTTLPACNSEMLISRTSIGKSAFWTKFGFVEVAPHIMLANGTVEGVSLIVSADVTLPLMLFCVQINMMILELEKPSSDRKQTSVSSVSPI